MNHYFCLIASITFFPYLLLHGETTTPNPLSKITITSQKAICQKDSNNPHLFVFQYLDKVTVSLADGSIITSDSLEIIFDGKSVEKKLKNQKQIAATTTTTTNNATPLPSKLSQFKKITFKNNVHLTSQNRTATAQQAEVNLIENICSFHGNVSISQKKIAEKDLPITIESQNAQLNLKTEELTFEGSFATPVSTVISLNDYEPLQKKSRSPQKNKRKKHRE